jgi:hypothetical protein
MSNNKVWIRAGITLHTDLEPEELTEELLLGLIKDKKWELDGETLIYREYEHQHDCVKVLEF